MSRRLSDDETNARRLALGDELQAVLVLVDAEFSSGARNMVDEQSAVVVVEISIQARKAVKDVLLKWKWYPDAPPVPRPQPQEEA